MNTDPRPPSRLPVGRVIRHRGVLRALFAAPPAGSTIRELAIRSGVPYASTWRLVEDLRRLGALRVEVIGPSRRVSVNAGSPLLDDLRRIAGVEFDPHRKAARRFADLASKLHAVRKVILFGSVSRGEARFAGPSPPERSCTSDLEEAEAWLASAEYLLGAAGQPRARFTVAIAQAIPPIIRSNDAPPLRFLGRRSTRHAD